MAKLEKKVVKSLLADVPEEKIFWCKSGETYRNLQELDIALKMMDNATYNYHVNEEKCDFGNWVKDVIGDEKLAQELAKSPTAAQAEKRVRERIEFLKKQAA